MRPVPKACTGGGRSTRHDPFTPLHGAARRAPRPLTRPERRPRGDAYGDRPVRVRPAEQGVPGLERPQELRADSERRLRERRPGLDARERRGGRRGERHPPPRRGDPPSVAPAARPPPPDPPPPPPLGGGTDHLSLALPAGGSATSPVPCTASAQPPFRLAARASGVDKHSRLKVELLYTGKKGAKRSAVVGKLRAGEEWAPTKKLAVRLGRVKTHGKLKWANVRFRFTPVGVGDWQVDDLYLAPRARR